MRSITRALLVLSASLALPLAAAQAQDNRPSNGDVQTAVALPSPADALDPGQIAAGPAPTPAHTGLRALALDFYDDIKHLPVKENLLIAGVGAGAALAVHPADNNVTPYMVNASWTHPTFVAGAYMGQLPTLLGASVGVYIVGRAQDNKKVSHVGMDMLEALMMSELLFQPVKYAVNRTRPNGTARGFPSGHAADTLAIATALERHAGWKYSIPAYMFASYVAASRLHDNLHYASDVIFGGAVGVIAGRTVTRHGAAFPISVVPQPGGAAILYTRNVD